MTTEDLQGQVARSAAVERELREEIGKLRAELAEARRHAREYRELYEEAEPSLRARATAAESALAEARGALKRARGHVLARSRVDEQDDNQEQARKNAAKAAATLAAIDAALARAGEQEAPEPRRGARLLRDMAGFSAPAGAFAVGERVRPSKKGLSANLWPPNRPVRTGGIPKGGVVVGIETPLGVRVLWDGRKTATAYHVDFIEPEPAK